MKTLSPELLLVASLAIAAVPLLIALGTCYLKFSIVLSLMKSGFGTQTAPSAALVTALSIVMSLMVMHPVLHETLERLSGVKLGDLSTLSIPAISEKSSEIIAPWRSFLLDHSGDRELVIFTKLSSPTAKGDEAGETVIEQVNRSDVPVVTALAAFVLSEIKKGFTLAFFLLIPFFVIDLIVANLLVAMGLTMMSPIIVSLPIKLLLFISSDGWLLLTKNMIQAYR
jgi:type III secretory pathway component EscR